MYIGVKYPLFLSDFNETKISSACFRKILKYQILLKSVQYEPKCFVWTDRLEEYNIRFFAVLRTRLKARGGERRIETNLWIDE